MHAISPNTPAVPSDRKRFKSRGTAAAVLVTGILSSGVLFITLRHKEREAVDDSFRRAVHNEVATFRRTIDSCFLVLESIQGFYAGSQSVERSEFHELVTPLLRHHSKLRALEWVPWVRDSDRARHEAQAARDGCASYRIADSSGERVRLRASRRDLYLPICYAEPAKPNEALLGVDLATSPEFLRVAHRSRDSGETLLTSSAILEREGVDPTLVHFLAPVYRNGAPRGTVEERREHLEGFVVAILAASDLVKESRGALAPIGVDVYLVNRSGAGGERLLAYHISRTRGPAASSVDPQQLGRSSELHHTEDLDLPGEKCSITCAAAPAFMEAEKTWQPWAGLACGLLLTVLLETYVVGAALRQARTEQFASRLAGTNRELQREMSDRKRLEEAMGVSERRHRLFAENVSEVIWTMDFSGRFTYASPSVRQLLGYLPEEFAQLTMGQVVAGSSLDLARKHLGEFVAAAAAGQRIGGGSLELELIRKERSIVWSGVTFSGMYDESGKMIAIQGVTRDISERKQAEVRQARLLRRFVAVNRLQEDLLQPAPLEAQFNKITATAVELLDLDFCRVWMVRPGDLCERGCVHAAAADARHACRRRDACLHLMASSGRYTHTDGGHRRVPIGNYKIGRIASGEDKKFLTNCVTTDPRVHDHAWAGQLGLVSFAGYKLHDAQAHPIGVLAMFAKHPISEEDDAFLSSLAETTSRVILRSREEEATRHAEQAARRENAKLSAMISGMEEGVVFADSNNVIVEINAYLCRFLGKPRSEILGKRIEEFHSGRALEGILRQIDRFRTDPGSDPFILQRRLGDAEVVLRVQPVYRDGQYDGVLLNVIDVSGLVEARRQAEAATRAKSEFLANMSHEIRTPLTALLGYTDLLMDPALSPSSRANHLAVVRRSGEHLLELINDILDLSKIEAGKLAMELQHCSVVSLVADVASLMRPHADQRGIQLAVDYPGEVPETILTDEARLRQSLVNLLGNAIKFTEQGEVRIVVTFLPAWRNGAAAVKFEVVDTGIGICREVLAGLFQPFTQGDSATARKFGGTGLGLAISRHLTELLGGELSAKSVPGQGSTFTLIVPTGDLRGVKMLQRPTEALQDAGSAPWRPVAENLRGIRILLAEDGFDNQELIRLVLRKAGAEVHIVANGRLAVEKAEAGSFDLILMDINMPEMDGYQATRILRDRGYRQPILALTANAMSGDKERCLAAGCNDHVAKPIDQARLIHLIAAHVGPVASEGRETPAPTQETPAGATGPVASQYAADPEMATILAGFVERLPGRVDAMRQTLARGEYEDLQRLAHNLKGSGGSYGYASLTEASRLLETAAKGRDEEGAAAALAEIAELCRAIHEGYVACVPAGETTP